MADFNRLVKEWEAVKAFWNREDNVSLSKHCEEKEVDYKRCITHNQPMRKLADRAARNKYADEQLAKFRGKLVPRREQGAERRASVASDHSEPAPAPAPAPRMTLEQEEELHALREANERLNTQKNDLADKVAELTARLRRLEAAPPAPSASDWEKKYLTIFKNKHNECNWWKALANRQVAQIQALKKAADDALLEVELPEGVHQWSERTYEVKELEENWEERARKASVLKPRRVVIATDAEEEKLDA
jgi:hypothetical protein